MHDVMVRQAMHGAALGGACSRSLWVWFALVLQWFGDGSEVRVEWRDKCCAELVPSVRECPHTALLPLQQPTAPDLDSIRDKAGRSLHSHDFEFKGDERALMHALPPGSSYIPPCYVP